IHYGNVTGRFKSFVNDLLDLLPRQALHARTLGFVHPATRELTRVQSELPADMREALRRLEEYYGM
ncbi:MAG: RNA pseudouridine synthase, partial [Bacteroidota bacterium]|nr:RNA pseudouridine synthase [Bacteroidota bacterium]